MTSEKRRLEEMIPAVVLPDEFGACDRDYAAAIVKAARPRRRIIVSSGEMA